MGHFLTSKLGPFSDLRTWAVFGPARTTFQGSACAELSKVRVTLETLIGNVTLLFLSHYDSTSHMQFLALTHERMARHAMTLTRVLVTAERRMKHATYASVLQSRRGDHGPRTQPCWSCANCIQCASNACDRSDMVMLVSNIDV